MFDSDPGPAQSLVQVLARNTPKNKPQALFQRLIASIQNKREALQEWRAYVQRYHERLGLELLPLQARLRDSLRALAAAIDVRLSQSDTGRSPSRVQRAKLEQVLLQLLTELLDDDADEATIALFEKYSETSYSELRDAEMELTRTLFEGVLGVDFGEATGATSAEQLLQHARHKLDQHAQDQQQRRAARAASKPGATRKAEAAQARKEQAEREVRQSIRDVYRKLASALHPDREPDAEQRQRKTLLLQRVNQAYEADDLLTLLDIQLEIEQIDSEHLIAVAPERLAHYNQILREQLADLDAEIDHMVLPFREMIGFAGRTIVPKQVDHCLSHDIADLREAVAQAETDLDDLHDPKRLSAFLKRHSRRADEEEFDVPGLSELLATIEAGGTPRARRRR